MTGEKETYTAGSTTTIGVGVSVPLPGEVGSFSAEEGTFTETSSGKEPFRIQHGTIVHMQSPYTFGEYRLCAMAQVQPEVWATGERAVMADPPSAVNCSGHFPKGGTFSRSTGTAGTFKAGVDIKKVIGINLSVQSGYTNNVSITWTFPSGGYLCGSNGLPSVAAWNVMDSTQFGNPAPHKNPSQK